ncbi:MAG: hypothetical protein IPL78_08585 [Chloroflexi bacterium]|nr:hypothetical protein [Chloroflexota bacterium]
MLTFVLMLLVVGGACGGLGWLIFQGVRGRNQTLTVDWLEAGFASLGLGVAVVGWLAVILAELGLFSLLALGASWLVLTLLLVGWLWRRGDSWRLSYTKPHVSHLALLLWLPVAGWLFCGRMKASRVEPMPACTSVWPPTSLKPDKSWFTTRPWRS